MLWWMIGVKWIEKIRIEEIRARAIVANIREKMREVRQLWLGNVERTTEDVMRTWKVEVSGHWKIWRSKLRWSDDVIQKDMNETGVQKEEAKDEERGEWKLDTPIPNRKIAEEDDKCVAILALTCNDRGYVQLRRSRVRGRISWGLSGSYLRSSNTAGSAWHRIGLPETITQCYTIDIKSKRHCFYIAQYPVCWTLKALYTSPLGRPVHSDTNSTSLGSILATELFIHISTTVYSQVHI